MSHQYIGLDLPSLALLEAVVEERDGGYSDFLWGKDHHIWRRMNELSEWRYKRDELDIPPNTRCARLLFDFQNHIAYALGEPTPYLIRADYVTMLRGYVKRLNARVTTDRRGEDLYDMWCLTAHIVYDYYLATRKGDAK